MAFRVNKLYEKGERDAHARSHTLVGDDWEAAVLYDALARVGRSLGIDTGEPLIWREVQAVRSDITAAYANASDRVHGDIK